MPDGQVRFNRLVRPSGSRVTNIMEAERVMTASAAPTLFLSHKTGDQAAEEEADYIAETHNVEVYMAEWDPRVDGDSNELPNHIMNNIRQSNGFLVCMSPLVATSMWVGYEIGGAHAFRKSRAKITYTHTVPADLPSVVESLRPLRSRRALDRWISMQVK